MKPIDRARFASAMNSLAVSKNAQFGEANIQVWWDLLKDLEIGDVEKAMTKVARDSSICLPPVGAIIEAVKGKAPPPMDLKDESELSWVKLDKGIKSVGRYRSISFDDPAIHIAVVGLGGWVHVCDKLDDDFTRRAFRQLYIAARKDIARTCLARVEVPLMLRGEHDEATPRFVGDRPAIAEWHQQSIGDESPFVELLLPPKNPLIGDASSTAVIRK